MPGSLTVRPAGNSTAINEIEDGELRDLVHELHRYFWNVWSEPFYFVPVVFLFLFFSLFMMAGTFLDASEGRWRAIAWVIVEGGLVYGLFRFIKKMLALIRNYRTSFAEFMRSKPRASEALQQLRRIERIRMWFLRSTLVTPFASTNSPNS